jgi:NAD(P)H-flavin reductase
MKTSDFVGNKQPPALVIPSEEPEVIDLLIIGPNGTLLAKLAEEAINNCMLPYKAKLKAQKTLCAGTTAFYFEKPEDFKFEPGQFANFTLRSPGSEDVEGNTRALSIASAPQERDLMVAMRLRSTAFKNTLHSLPFDSELLLQGPYGSMTLSRNGTRPAVFLAGGIGITPFRSLIRRMRERPGKVKRDESRRRCYRNGFQI